MAINIITGRPGSGKTYILTKIALEFLKEGRTVFSNYFIDWDKNNLHFFDKVEELKSLEKGIIVMDEGQIYFNSRNWENLSETMQYKLQQHRKDGLDIWATVQNIKRIDILIRELVSRYFECKSLICFNFLKEHYELFIKKEYDVEDEEVKDKRECFGTELIFFEPEIGNRYDTLKKISLPVTDIVQLNFKKCLQCGRLHKVT